MSRAGRFPGLPDLDPSQVPTEREAFEWLRGLAMEGDMRAAMALFAWADAVDEARGVPGIEVEVIDFGRAP